MRAVLLSVLLLAACADKGTLVDVDVTGLASATSVELYIGQTACGSCDGVRGPDMTATSPPNDAFLRTTGDPIAGDVATGHVVFHIESDKGTTDISELVAVVRDDLDRPIGYAKVEALDIGQHAKKIEMAAAAIAHAEPATTGDMAIHAWHADGDKTTRCLVLETIGDAAHTFAIIDKNDPDCDGIPSADECPGSADIAQADLPAGTVCLTQSSSDQTPVCRLGRDCAGGTCDGSTVCVDAAACGCNVNDLACVRTHAPPVLACGAILPGIGESCTDAIVSFDLHERLTGCQTQAPVVTIAGDRPDAAFRDFAATATFASGATATAAIDGCAGTLTIHGHGSPTMTVDDDHGLIAFVLPTGVGVVVPFVVRYGIGGGCDPTSHDPMVIPCDRISGDTGSTVFSCVND